MKIGNTQTKHTLNFLKSTKKDFLESNKLYRQTQQKIENMTLAFKKLKKVLSNVI